VTATSAAQTAAVTVLSVALLAGAVQLQAAREKHYPPRESDEETLYMQSGTTLKRVSGAYSLLGADLYWIRAIQYYGGTKQRLEAEAHWPAPPPLLARDTSDDYRLLFPLLEITTTLDPRFTIAYRFGAVFLAEAQPRGAGRPDQAVALLEKGLAARPDKWEYMQDIGFVHYWYVHDYRAAAGWFRRASEVSNAPWWLKSLAATTLAQGGDRRSSRAMWAAIHESADNDWLRSDAERRLLQLRALDEIDELQRRLDRYASRVGHPAATWNELARAGLLAGVPLDPVRAPYELTDGRASMSRSSSLWPLPVEPERLSPAPDAAPAGRP
jgi:tetratricopeptide (TPR) repeat protein